MENFENNISISASVVLKRISAILTGNLILAMEKCPINIVPKITVNPLSRYADCVVFLKKNSEFITLR